MHTNTNLFKYDLFLAEQVMEQAKFEACIEETLLLNSGKSITENMTIVTESVAEKFKETIKKILNAIANVWEKFKEAMNTLIKKDEDYLKKYKDIILNKKPINADYTMYNYQKGVSNILNSSLPPFNYNNMKDSLESKDDFINKYLRKYTYGDGKTNFIDGVKNYFRGSSQLKKINSAQLNMTDLYNYCITYKKIEDLIHKDLTNIQNAANDAINMVEKMGIENKIAQESANIFGEVRYYSFLQEQYITEEENKSNNNSNNNNSNNSNSNNSSNDNKSGDKVSNTVSRSVNNNKPNEHYKSSNNSKDNEDNKMKEEDVDGSVKVVTDRIKVYLSVCSEFIAAKESIAEEIYKAYISILKAHVRDHVGKKGENKPKDTATNYSPNNNEENSNNNNNGENNNDNNNGDSKPKEGKTKGIFKRTVDKIKNNNSNNNNSNDNENKGSGGKLKNFFKR